MQHVDALSRCINVMVITENSFETNLAILQNKDTIISKLIEQLSRTELPFDEMKNGIVYRKTKDNKLLFYVPNVMIDNIIHLCHDDVGIDKVVELISRAYWFPKVKERVKNYVSQCLKCITYSPILGKQEGILHPIPKGTLPFDTVHTDHYGPLEKSPQQHRFIFEVIDAFTKFIKSYPCRTTNTKELIKHLNDYFRNYSRPSRIVSDRGSSFKSEDFEEF